MPPKPKEIPKNVTRPPISDSSLVFVPDDVIEGYQDRLENCVEWTLIEGACRYHRKRCKKENITKLSFSEAYQKKLDNSIVKGFLDDESKLTVEQHWEMLLPLLVWDSEKCATDEGRICFQNANLFTEGIMSLIQKTVRLNDRNILREGLLNVQTLRINEAKMTHLDDGLKKFQRLITLNLTGNYISALKSGDIPLGVKLLEMQANAVSDVDKVIRKLPVTLTYLGLSRNLLTDESIQGMHHLPYNLTVLDLADNDISDLVSLLNELAKHPNLISLNLAGNPCSLCMAYAHTVTSMMPHLRWLDLREILPTDRPDDSYAPHPDDLRSTYFTFNILRIMSPPIPPPTEKGIVAAFHIELELPLLDSQRRRFLFFHHTESLTEMLPEPEDTEIGSSALSESQPESKFGLEGENESESTDVFARLVTKSSREIINYTTFESTKVPWSKVLTFQDPVVRIFCPDLFALRDTFRSVVTVRFVYSQTYTVKGKANAKSSLALKPPPQYQSVVLATIKCSLQRTDWSQPQQHFHWDDSLGTQDAIHWGDGNLAVLQYIMPQLKTQKGTSDPIKLNIPDNLTCHFSFGFGW